jgi:hypothetical protein
MRNSVKHSLIILSKRLLSSLLTSFEKKEETLYRWVNPDLDELEQLQLKVHLHEGGGLELLRSPYVWKRFGDKQTQPRYEGEIKREYILFGDYIFEGLGSLVFLNGNKYVGSWKDGERNGQGTFSSPDGDKYVGEWKNGKKNGQGTYTWKDGRKYLGEYKDGKRHGQGTQTWSDGMKYVGEWKNGREWNGTSYNKNGNTHEKFVNGKEVKP